MSSLPRSSFPITWYRKAWKSRAGVVISMSRADFEIQMAAPSTHRGPKGDLPLICPATFVDGHRKNENVERVHLLGLDIDEPQVDPAAYVARISAALGGVEVFAYSTFSSQAGAFKLRALVPYDVGATGEEHRASWLLATRVLARHGVRVDLACKDPARGFYVWALPPSGAYFATHVEGEPWPVAYAAKVEAARLAAAEPAIPARVARFVAPAADRIDRARLYLEKVPGAVSGQGGSRHTFKIAVKLVRGFALDDEDALSVLREWSAATCKPTWSVRELKHKIRQARDVGRMPVGALLAMPRRA